MAFATAELYWLRMLLQELQLPLKFPPVLWCDNIGALSLASNPIFHARTKHVEVNYHFIREKIARKDLITRYLPTLDQIADIFTKGLTSARFFLLRDKLKVCLSPISLRGAVNTQSVAHSTVHIADSVVAHTAGTTSVHTAPQPADQSHTAALHTAT